jgi:hypothetical protein
MMNKVHIKCSNSNSTISRSSHGGGRGGGNSIIQQQQLQCSSSTGLQQDYNFACSFVWV